MKTNELANLPQFTCVVEGASHELSGVYCADLLSWAMSRAPENSVWCTVMGNVNMLAVASLTEVAAVILCEDALLDEAARTRAEQEKISVFTTSLPAFEAGIVVAKAADFLI